MNCEQFEQLAPQIAHNELRDGKVLQDAANHAAQCGACDAILVEAQELAGVVASLAAQDKLMAVPARMESRLRAEFVRERAGHRPAPTRPGRVVVGATFRWAAVSLAAAAIILAIIFLPRLLNRKSETDRAAITPARSTSRAAADTKIAQAPTAIKPVVQKHLAATHKPKKNLTEPETTLTGFLALPYADDLSTIEYGAIVRLQMSRADLAWLGLPVSISDNGEKVVADLFVNGSGTPEAIRLVR
jgi:hypothetical protein